MTEPGGFIPSSTYLPSPAPTNYSFTATRSSGVLPNQRSTPLKSGSKRETAFINYVDNALLEIARKFTKKFPTDEEKAEAANSTAANPNAGVVVGYSDVEPLVEDLEKIIGLVWVSGTPFFQIAYLLQIASSLLQYFPPFPPRPTPTFRIFNKLDLAFHILLSDYRMSGTEKVRLNSIVKVSRAMVVRLMEGGDFLEESQLGGHDDGAVQDTEDSGSDSDLDLEVVHYDELEKGDDDDNMEVDEETEGEASRLQRQYRRPTKKEVDRTERIVEEEKEDESWEIEVARVYSRVLEDIGEDLGGDPIGVITG